MSQSELTEEIELLRTKLNKLAESGAGYDEILKTSQELDELIVMYYNIAA